MLTSSALVHAARSCSRPKIALLGLKAWRRNCASPKTLSHRSHEVQAQTCATVLAVSDPHTDLPEGSCYLRRSSARGQQEQPTSHSSALCWQTSPVKCSHRCKLAQPQLTASAKPPLTIKLHRKFLCAWHRPHVSAERALVMPRAQYGKTCGAWRQNALFSGC